MLLFPSTLLRVDLADKGGQNSRHTELCSLTYTHVNKPDIFAVNWIKSPTRLNDSARCASVIKPLKLANVFRRKHQGQNNESWQRISLDMK